MEVPLDAIVRRARGLDPSAHLVAERGQRDPVAVSSVAVVGAEADVGSLFAALPGARHHGAEFAGQARLRGAVAALSDRPLAGLPTVVVRDPRAVLGPLAAAVAGHPSAALAVHGVTGTNGKTSTARLLAAGLAAAGRTTSWSTTLERVTPSTRHDATRTTPEAPELQRFLAAARDEGSADVVLEVSSHGLALDRVTGTRFRTGVFTNLTPDHLDLHADVERYFEAKASLFTPDRCGTAVVVVDDRWGARLARRTRCPVVTVSAAGAPADWRVEDVHADLTGTRFRLRGPGLDTTVGLRLLGAHQAVNAAAALAALAADGADPEPAAAGLADVVLDGRLERVDAGQGFPAFVDFAHNEGGHERLLPFLRSLAPGRLVVVAGITGERDAGKPARLGARIARDADVLVVTDESPHSQDPRALRAALLDGARSASGGAVVVEEPDRATAFARAAAHTGPGDVLVVVGRGADPVRTAAGVSTPFDDRVELRRALAAVAPTAV